MIKKINKSNYKVLFIEGTNFIETNKLTLKQAETFAKLMGKNVQVKYLQATISLENFIKACDSVELTDKPITRENDDDTIE